MTTTGRAAAALFLAAVLGLGACAKDDGEAINPRPVPPAPTSTPTPGQDLNP